MSSRGLGRPRRRAAKPLAEPVAGRGGTGRAETALERWDRNFAELLQELRVAQTGVQILFAFLLSLPFTNRFGQIDQLDRLTYMITLIAAATATAFLIAPASYHRLVFRQGRKPEVVAMASRMATLGLLCLLVAVVGAVFLVTDVVFESTVAAVTGGALIGLYVFLWYVMPFLHRHRRP
jgi:hypothetical protein